MFKKFVIVIIPFVLAELSTTIISSQASVANRVTGWRPCTFSTFYNQFTPVRITKEYSSNGKAARPISIEIASENSEPIVQAQVWESQDGKRIASTIPYNLHSATGYWQHSIDNFPFTKLGGTVTVWLYSANKDVCTYSFNLDYNY